MDRLQYIVKYVAVYIMQLVYSLYFMQASRRIPSASIPSLFHLCNKIYQHRNQNKVLVIEMGYFFTVIFLLKLHILLILRESGIVTHANQNNKTIYYINIENNMYDK